MVRDKHTNTYIMKHVILSSLFLVLITGCGSATTSTAPKTPVPQPEEEVVLIPSSAYAPPGQMVMTWSPREQAPEPEAQRPKRSAKPYFTSNKRTRGRLFVLPTTREN